MKTILSILFPVALLVISCNSQPSETFNPDDVKPIIKEIEKKWSDGARQSNLSIISSIYAENAHYVPDQQKTQHGIKSITELWEKELTVIKDVVLNIESLEGTKDILYETGNGYSLLLNQTDKSKLDTVKFKYVNVWRMQLDGSYKCVIDTYNDVYKEN